MKICFLILSFLLIVGCSKDNPTETRPDCEVNHTGNFYVTNDATYSIKITINGSYRDDYTLQPGQRILATKVPAGVYFNLKVYRISTGWLVLNSQELVAQCENIDLHVK